MPGSRFDRVCGLRRRGTEMPVVKEDAFALTDPWKREACEAGPCGAAAG